MIGNRIKRENLLTFVNSKRILLSLISNVVSCDNLTTIFLSYRRSDREIDKVGTCMKKKHSDTHKTNTERHTEGDTQTSREKPDVDTQKRNPNIQRYIQDRYIRHTFTQVVEMDTHNDNKTDIDKHVKVGVGLHKETYRLNN